MHFAPSVHGARHLPAALLASAVLIAGCASSTVQIPATGQVDLGAPMEVGMGSAAVYGPATPFGAGTARTYIVWSTDAQRRPSEIGLVLDAAAVERADGISERLQKVLELPTGAPAPFTFVLLDWNPQGHEPPGIYDVAHFDVHFYTTPVAELEGIVPGPDFATYANRLPTGDYVPEHYIVAAPPGRGAEAAAVPGMGVHWVDIRSPELQHMTGNHDAHRPFTKTFIYGSWDGRMTFFEPMVTREFLMTKPDVTTPIPVAKRHATAGWYPSAYRVHYDSTANEYRISLLQFERFDGSQ